VLRNELKLTGPRPRFADGAVRACSRAADGEEVRACITPVSYAVGQAGYHHRRPPAVWAMQKGLSAPDAAKTLHPSTSVEMTTGAECGYCQSGYRSFRGAVLAKNPNPTVAQIKDAFTKHPASPHLCRCGTYTAIIDAVATRRHRDARGKQAPPMTPKIKRPANCQSRQSRSSRHSQPPSRAAAS